MIDLIIFFSIVAWIVSLLFFNTATAGVGIALFAVWIVILARIQQAHKHHRQLLAALEGPDTK